METAAKAFYNQRSYDETNFVRRMRSFGWVLNVCTNSQNWSPEKCTISFPKTLRRLCSKTNWVPFRNQFCRLTSSTGKNFFSIGSRLLIGYATGHAHLFDAGLPEWVVGAVAPIIIVAKWDNFRRDFQLVPKCWLFLLKVAVAGSVEARPKNKMRRLND